MPVSINIPPVFSSTHPSTPSCLFDWNKILYGQSTFNNIYFYINKSYFGFRPPSSTPSHPVCNNSQKIYAPSSVSTQFYSFNFSVLKYLLSRVLNYHKNWSLLLMSFDHPETTKHNNKKPVKCVYEEGAHNFTTVKLFTLLICNVSEEETFLFAPTACRNSSIWMQTEILTLKAYNYTLFIFH